MKIDAILLSIYAGVFLSLMNSSFISSFFPQFAEERHISEDYIGIIFSSVSFGELLSSLIVGIYQTKQGLKKISMISGLVLQGIGLFVFTYLAQIFNEEKFIFLAIFGRLIIGIGEGMFITPSYAYLPLLYSDSLENKIGFLESVNGFGLMIGPMYGGLFSQFISYETPFYISIIAIALLLPIAVIYIPFNPTHRSSYVRLDSNQIEHVYKEYENEQQKRQTQHLTEEQNKELLTKKLEDEFIRSSLAQQNNQKVNYCQIICNRSMIFTVIITLVPAIGLLFLDPTLAPYLQRQYKLDSSLIGIIFAASSLLYVILCPFGSQIFTQYQKNKLYLFIGCFLIGICFILLGPDSEMCFGIGQHLWITILANLMVGISNIFSFIPIVPEILNILNAYFPHQEGEVNADISSAIYSSAFAMGSLIGPIAGGFLVQKYGFPKGASYLGITFVTVSLIYLVGEVIFSKNTSTNQQSPGKNEQNKVSNHQQKQYNELSYPDQIQISKNEIKQNQEQELSTVIQSVHQSANFNEIQ